MALLIFGILIAMSIIMALAWLYQRAVQNGGWTDVFWTYGTGVTCAAATLIPTGEGGFTWRQAFVAILVLTWSLRLGTYVALRVASTKEDARYAGLRQDWKPHFQMKMFWLLMAQAPVTALLGIGVLFAGHRGGEAFRFLDGVGLAILVGSIAGETIADGQMKRFKAASENEGKVCDKGLWGWSRHPNYFFEFLSWIAYPIIAIDTTNPWTWLSLISPTLMFLVLRFGTGVPPLEEAMMRSKGEAYRHYQAKVSAMLLLPPKLKAGDH